MLGPVASDKNTLCKIIVSSPFGPPWVNNQLHWLCQLYAMSRKKKILGWLEAVPLSVPNGICRLKELTPAARARKHRELSIALWKTGFLAQAIPHLREVYRLQPHDQQAVVDLAQAFHQLGQDDLIEEAIESAPFEISAFWYLLGHLFPSRIAADGTVRNLNRLGGVFLIPINKSLAAMGRARLRAELVIGLTGNEAAFFRILSRRWRIQQNLLKCLGLTDAPRRYLTNYWIRKIGHIGQIEFLFKAMKVGLVPARKLTVLCKSDAEAANPALLKCWSSHLDIFVEKEKNSNLALEAQILGVDIHCFDAANHSGPYYHKEVAAKAYRLWEEQNLPALLTPRKCLVDRGRAAFCQIGIPKDAWFVTVHARESAFTNDKNGSPRNASIENYRMAIDEVIARGGYVVRIGDSSMQALPARPHLFDYAKSDIKSDWMDVFLLSCCRFFIGGASGPAQVPPLFSVPCVYTNWMPMGDYPFNPLGILIHKKHFNRETGSPISYTQMMSISSDSQALLERSNIILEENTEREILEAVKEMLEKLDGTSVVDAEDDFLQSKFRLLARFDHGRPKLGQAFIKANVDQLVE